MKSDIVRIFTLTELAGWFTLTLLFSLPAHAVKMNTVASASCTKAHLTRYIHLREDAARGAQCDVLYVKPDETQSVKKSWSANNQRGYCRTKYNGFLSKLTNDLEWTCSDMLRAAADDPRTDGGRPGNAVDGNNTQRVLKPDGSVELTYSDGRKTTISNSGESTVYPDGTQSQSLYSEAPALIPPSTPVSHTHTNWLENIADSLLYIIKLLVGFDEESVAAYISSEQSENSYENISTRATVISRLLR